MRLKKLLPAFTMIEVLIVVTILGLLTLAVISGMAGQRNKADDARAKADLSRIKIAFEDYYGDNNCYPPPAWFDNANDCGSSTLSPYLTTIPCDRNTGLPYYLLYPEGQCDSYVLLSTLNNPGDPDSLTSPITIGSHTYSYGVASSNLSLADGLPFDDVTHDYFYCSGVSNCTGFNPENEICSPFFIDEPSCNGCASAGTCSPR